MSLRITTFHMTNQALAAAHRHQSSMARLQEQLSTGLRIHRPSDDPIATRALLSFRSSEQRLSADISNIQSARAKLNLSVSQLLEAKDIMVSLQTLAQDSMQSGERQTLSEQAERLLQRLLQVANTEVDDEFLFSGTAVRTRPFELTTHGSTEGVAYRGARQPVQLMVGGGALVDTHSSGSVLFLHQQRQATQFRGQTGAAPGTRADSGVGRRTLTLQHLQTSYAGASGVAPGASSTTGDTILGPPGAHELQIDAVQGTLSLNNGPPVAFGPLDTDLPVVGPQGERVYVDASNIAAGFVGTAAIEAAGSLQLDDSPPLAIDFSSHQAAVHAPTGQITHVDTRNVRRIGTETIDHIGTVDAFTAVSQFRDDLRQSTQLSSAEWEQLATHALGEFDRYLDHFLERAGEQSSTLKLLDDFETRNEDLQLELSRMTANLENADISQVAIELQTTQNLLQYTYASTARLFQNSLLNYL